MKFYILLIFTGIFQAFIWAETPLNKKLGTVHIEHPDHVPHHPAHRDPTDQGGHDGVVYPRKKFKK